MKYFYVSIFSILLLGSSSLCQAHADKLEIEIIDFLNHKNGESYIIFEAVDSREDGKTVEKRKRKYHLHIRFNLKNLAFSVTKQEHDIAFEYLQSLINKNKKITIWRMSGTGYRPIHNKKGHYRTDALKIISFANNQEGIMFVHGSNSFFATY